MIKVALIDSGVERNHPALFDRPIQGIELIENAGEFSWHNAITDANGHGTSMAGIIFDKCPEVELFSIRILDSKLHSSFVALERALELAIAEKVQIINLSLGTTFDQYRDRLQELCQQARAQGIYIVAALHNQEEISYPAVFPEVLGVRGGLIREKYGFSYQPAEQIQITAKGNLQKVCWLDNGEKYVQGNSYASAHFTGILAKLLNEADDQQWASVEGLLQEKAMAMKTQPDHPQATVWIQRALLFPVTEENLELLKLEEALDHEIVGIYDPRPFYLPTFELTSQQGVVKKRFFNDLTEGLAEVDTVLVGDLSFLPAQTRDEWLRRVVGKSIELGKNVFLKDPLPPDQYAELYEQAKKQDVTLISKYL